MTTTSTTTVDLTPGRWKIDPGHAEIGFIGRHFGLTKIRGRFTGVDGSVEIAHELSHSSIDVTIDMASVNSGDASRDDHLRSTDFFDVANFPVGRFVSTSISVDGAAGVIEGELTIKGVQRPIELDVQLLGTVVDPWGGRRAILRAAGSINREDWGLTWNMILDTGGLLVSKKIQLEIEVELLHEPG